MISLLGSAAELEERLKAGAVGCPGCREPLARWGWARPRVLRTRCGTQLVRPRRAICHGCQATHVLLAAPWVPLRRDSTEVIGAALLASAMGSGHRQIAADLQRPAGTVRGWLRRARARSEDLRASASRWAVALDPELGAVLPSGRGRFGDAVQALGVAARAWALWLGPARPWEVAVHITGGLLISGQFRDPP